MEIIELSKLKDSKRWVRGLIEEDFSGLKSLEVSDLDLDCEKSMAVIHEERVYICNNGEDADLLKQAFKPQRIEEESLLDLGEGYWNQDDYYIKNFKKFLTKATEELGASEDMIQKLQEAFDEGKEELHETLKVMVFFNNSLKTSYEIRYKPVSDDYYTTLYFYKAIQKDK